MASSKGGGPGANGVESPAPTLAPKRSGRFRHLPPRNVGAWYDGGMRSRSYALVITAFAVALGSSAAGCVPERECDVNADCALIERCTPAGDCVLIDDPQPSPAPEADGGNEPEGFADAGIPPGGDVDGGGLPPPPEEGVTLDRVELVPGVATAPVGTVIAFVAVGHAVDGAMYDVTQNATWSSSATNVVDVDVDGRARVNAEGEAVVRALAFGETGAAAITATAAEPVDLVLTPAEVVLAETQSVSVVATSRFTNGEERDMTDVVTWATEDGTVATVDGGRVTGIAAGSTSVVAIFGPLNTSAVVVVESAPIASLTIDTTDDGINAGLIATFTATGTFADTSVDDVTSQLVWTTSNAALAQPLAGAPGRIRTLAEGSVVVTATDPATGLSADLTLNIGPVRLITVSVRDKHTLVSKTDGTVWAWGDNRFGQLGGSTPDACGTDAEDLYPCATSAIRIDNLPIIRAVSAGTQQSYGIDESGQVWAWGNDEYGQLGRGTFGNAVNPTPALVLTDGDVPFGNSPETAAVQVSSGFIHTLALTADGTVYAWGAGGQGRLGLGDENARNRAAVVEGLPPIVFVQAGQFHSLAVDDQRRLWAWGAGGDGQQALAPGTHQMEPRLVTGPGAEDLRGAVGGWAHTATIDGTGALYAVGRGTEGQLGRGGFTSSSTIAAAGITGVMRLAAGNLHMGAVLANGRVRTWGYGAFGQLGNGARTSAATPVAVLGPGTENELVEIQALFSGADHMLAVGNDLTLYSWGRNENGQLGIGAWSVGDVRTRPIVLPPF